MAALNIDPTHWQEIYPSTDSGVDLYGTVLFINTTVPGFLSGATFLREPSSAASQWQFFPLNSTTYALRTKESGPKGFLNTQYAADVKATGQTAVNTRNSTISDEAMLWNIGNWPDGSLFFTNVANGSDYLMSANGNGSILMASNGSSAATAQSWQIRQGDPINDSAYSFVLGLPINTASSTPTPTTAKAVPTSTSAAAFTSAPSSSALPSSTPAASHQGLSSGASAGIGVGVTAVSLIAIISLMFLWLRKRKAKSVNHEKQLSPSPPPPPSYDPGMLKAELASDRTFVSKPQTERIEMHPAEVEARVPLAELTGETNGYR